MYKTICQENTILRMTIMTKYYVDVIVNYIVEAEDKEMASKLAKANIYITHYKDNVLYLNDVTINDVGECVVSVSDNIS